MAKKMIIRIMGDGRTEIRVEGGQGDDCLAFTQAMERAVGRVAQRELTADYHDHDVLTVHADEKIKGHETL
jgi:hypothetical protein